MLTIGAVIAGETANAYKMKSARRVARNDPENPPTQRDRINTANLLRENPALVPHMRSHLRRNNQESGARIIEGIAEEQGVSSWQQR